jgi:hypothetical protein
MPDHDLSLKQIESLLDYLASGGLESARQDERDADTATPAEINGGRRLFYGEAHLAHAGPACSPCHSVQDAGWARGGSLGPNLTAAYLKYQDKALTSFLERPCFPRAPDLSGAALLTPEESFDLKAYLRQVSLSQTQLTMHARTLHPGQTATLIGSRGSHRNTKGLHEDQLPFQSVALLSIRSVSLTSAAESQFFAFWADKSSRFNQTLLEVVNSDEWRLYFS